MSSDRADAIGREGGVGMSTTIETCQCRHCNCAEPTRVGQYCRVCWRFDLRPPDLSDGGVVSHIPIWGPIEEQTDG